MLIELFPLAEYLAGVHTSAEIEVPDAVRGYLLSLSRCTDDTPDIWTDPQQLLRVQVELHAVGTWMQKSPDGKSQSPQRLDGWSPWGSFDAYGGKHVQRSGVVAETSWLKAGLNVPLQNRRLRVFLLAAAAVRTRIVIEV